MGGGVTKKGARIQVQRSRVVKTGIEVGKEKPQLQKGTIKKNITFLWGGECSASDTVVWGFLSQMGSTEGRSG